MTLSEGEVLHSGSAYSLEDASASLTKSSVTYHFSAGEVLSCQCSVSINVGHMNLLGS